MTSRDVPTGDGGQRWLPRRSPLSRLSSLPLLSSLSRRWSESRFGAGWSSSRLWSRPVARRLVTGLLVLVVAMVGAGIGLLLGGRTVTDVGPFRTEFALVPSWGGQTSLVIPPLGALHLDSHDGPTHLQVRLGALDQARTQQMINDPGGVTRATETVADDVIEGVIRLGLGAIGAAVLGAMLLGALVFRNVRKVAWTGGLSLAVLVGSIGVAAGTFRLSAIEEPRYEGLLVHAPTLVGDVQRIADEYERYTDSLQQMLTNVSVLYTAASTLEDFQPDDTMTRVLHVADLHLSPSAWSVMRTVVEQYDVDFIIDSGDIVDWGSGPESNYLNSIRLMRVPYVWVRGNHDSENETQAMVAEQPNAIVLDDDVVTLNGLTIAGIGDPRFTPDQDTGPFTEEETQRIQDQVIGSGEQLADTVRRHPAPVDIGVVHDPIVAEPLAGVVPLVLAGHRHNRAVGPVLEVLYPEPEDAEQAQREAEEAQEAREAQEPADEEQLPPETLLMVQGSTGGAGLRGLEGEHPQPLAMSVLYFDDEQRLIAYDDITIGGHGLSEASVQRHLLDRDTDDSEQTGDVSGAGGAGENDDIDSETEQSPAGATPTPED